MEDNEVKKTIKMAKLRAIIMENNKSLTQVTTMVGVKEFAGKIVACAPRTKLGESLINADLGINFSFINPLVDVLWHRETGFQEQYHYFYVLNRFGNKIMTRVISEKTLTQEPLSLRLVNEQEAKYLLKYLQDDYDIMEFNGRAEYQESCATYQRLNLSDKPLKELLSAVISKKSVTAEKQVGIIRENTTDWAETTKMN